MQKPNLKANIIFILLVVFVSICFPCQFILTAKPAEEFAYISAGDVFPDRWIYNQLMDDLTNGPAMVLDQLSPTRFGSQVFSDPESNHVYYNQSVWWGSAEYEGNWYDGLARMAYGTDYEPTRTKIDELVQDVINGVQSNGYIGIYPERVRWQQCGVSNNNAELWASACILRALTSYYELTSNTDVLSAAVNMADQIPLYYNSSHPYFENDDGTYGAPAHGLALVDVYERLYRLTGNHGYVKYAEWLYEDYNNAVDIREKDIWLSRLNDLSSDYWGHGAHIMEHMRVPIFLYYATGDPKYKTAFENSMIKMKRYLLPSGAIVSDEFVRYRDPDASLHTEGCTMVEEMITLQSFLQKTGNAEYGDMIEKLVFNGVQGARTEGRPDGISYLTNDNRHEAVSNSTFQARCLYSPVHTDAPSCCPANFTRVMSYYVNNMWMFRKGSDRGFAAVCFGPSKLRSRLDSANEVWIDEVTSYPFSQTVRFKIYPQNGDVSFCLWARKPDWADSVTVTVPDGTVQVYTNGFYKFTKTWTSGDNVVLEFHDFIEVKQHLVEDQYYIQYGPLVYAKALEYDASLYRTLPLGFSEYEYTMQTGQSTEHYINENQSFQYVDAGGDFDNPYLYPPRKINGWLKNSSNVWEAVTLWPMADSILRQVTVGWW